jgi:hypothetical protein
LNKSVAAQEPTILTDDPRSESYGSDKREIAMSWVAMMLAEGRGGYKRTMENHRDLRENRLLPREP